MKTNELTGAALDWAVAKCEGWETVTAKDNTGEHLWLMKGDKDMNPKHCRYSTNWAQGGPIIEREWVDLHCVNDSLWEAECPAVGGLAMQNGPTPLIAAMRCYVASKLGDEIELPKELT
jgi:hypothetical protein